MSARRIPVVLMRGGARRALFFHRRDLPACDRERDAALLQLLAGPPGDPAGALRDACGGNVVLVAPSDREGRDVDCLSGTLTVPRGPLGWRPGVCDQLAAAAASFALSEGLVDAVEGATRVRIGPGVGGRRIDAHVPVRGGEVAEAGAVAGQGASVPGTQVRLDFEGAIGGDETRPRPLLPTGNPRDLLEVPGLGPVAATIVDAGCATVFVRADALGLSGRELPGPAARMRRALERLEALRAVAESRIAPGARGSPEAAQACAVPLAITWVARPASYRTTDGADVPADRVDLLARSLVASRLQPGDDGPGAIALAAAAALPGSVVAEVARTLPGLPVRIGQAAGPLAAGADLTQRAGRWRVERAAIARSARRLMTGWAHLPPAADPHRA